MEPHLWFMIYQNNKMKFSGNTVEKWRNKHFLIYVYFIKFEL